MRGGFDLFDFPYRSQEDPDAAHFRNDCGPACVAMILDWQGIHLRVDELSKETGLAMRDNGLLLSELQALLALYGIQALPAVDYALALADHQPVLSLIHYGEISERQNVAFRGLHYVVALRIEGDFIVVNDPDFWTPLRAKGQGFHIPLAEWKRAYVDGIRVFPSSRN